MKLRDRIEQNIVVWFLGTVMVAFGAGFGAYQAFLESARLDLVTHGTYIDLSRVTDQVIRWDPEIAQYVPTFTEDSYVKLIPSEDLLILFSIESENRSLLRSRFQQVKAQLIQRSRKDILSELLSASVEAFGQVERKDRMSLLLTEGQFAISQFRTKREELLRNVAQQEQQAIDRANQGVASSFPPGPVSAALLNLRESMRKLVRVNGGRIRDQVASFLEEKWVPIFLESFTEGSQAMFSNAVESEVTDMIREWLIVALKEAESKEIEFLKPLENWERTSLAEVDGVFNELLLSDNPELSQATSMRDRLQSGAEDLSRKYSSLLRESLERH